MNNTDVFKDFDMVVSITERSINDQLTHLLRMGTISPELVIVQELNEQTDEFEFKVLDSSDDIEFDGKGNPYSATIAVEIKPKISINDSGKTVTFMLEFTGGYAWFWKGTGPKAKLVKYDATGWQYAVAINMDFKQLKKDNLENNVKVPDFVEEQLTQFMSNMFDVNHLFMNFQSADLMRFDPDKTNAGDAKDVGVEQLVTFMNFYLKWLTKTGNPFILGYSITQNDKTAVPDEAKVPDSIKPVGTTYTMYRDNLHPHLSTLNFTLVTKGGYKTIRRSPDNFDTNWITPEDQCDAKMIYAASRFSEEFILKPLFEKLRDETHDKLKGALTLVAKRSYDQAKKVLPQGYRFEVADQNLDTDIYKNSYDVEIINEPGATHYKVKGSIIVYKKKTKDMFFCEAEASARALTEWEATFTVMVEKDAQGQPTLAFKQKCEVKRFENTKDKNNCAKAWDAIGEILSTLSSVFDLVGLNLSSLVNEIFKTNTPGIGDIRVALSNMDNSFNNAIMLPAGGVFFFKNPVADTAGNMAMSLTYKADSEVKVATQKFQQKRQLLQTKRRVNLALMGTVLQPEISE
jgi:hypothetical protein